MVTWPEKGFNFSAINNFGRKAAQGEYLLLLNNDVEVRNGDWLTELLRQCAHPGGAAICAAPLPCRTFPPSRVPACWSGPACGTR